MWCELVLERATEYQKMAEAESVLWWYRALHERVIAGLKDSFGDRRDLAILDVGCGTGGTMQALRQAGYTKVRGIDLSEHAVRTCQERQLDAQLGDARHACSGISPHTLDAIVLNDIIYFLPLDAWPDIFSTYHQALRPGGIIIINAPALPAFRGIHDLAVGIDKRLRPIDLPRLFKTHEFTLERQRFWPVLLSPLIYTTRLGQRLKLALFRNVPVESDVAIPAPWLNHFLYKVTRLESKIPWVPSWASSLFVILRAL